MFTAARRFCPAVLASPRAATTPDTVLTPGCVTRSLTDVLSWESAELSELVWSWYWPCASFTKVVSAALTSLRSAVISFTMPVLTLRCRSLSSEPRKAAASVHRTEFDGEAAGEAVVDDEGALEDVLPAEVPLPDPQPASSVRPQTTRTSLHRAGLVMIPGFISPIGCRAARHPRLTLSGLFPLSMTASAVRELAGYHGQISAVQAASSSRSQRAIWPTTTLTLSDLPRAVRGRPLVSAAVVAFSYSPAKRRDGGHYGGGMPPGMAGPSGCHPAAAGLRSARPT